MNGWDDRNGGVSREIVTITRSALFFCFRDGFFSGLKQFILCFSIPFFCSQFECLLKHDLLDLEWHIQEMFDQTWS